MSYSTQTGTINIESPVDSISSYEATGLAGGGIASLYTRSSSGNPAQYFLEMFDASGTQIGQLISLRGFVSTTMENYTFRVLGLSDGKVAVAYYKPSTTGVGPGNAYFFVVDQSGNKVVADTQINTFTGSSLTRALDLVELENGNIAFSYQRADNASHATRVFTPTGTAVSAETLASNSISSLSAIAANKNGGYIVTYGNNGALDFKIYSADGVQQSAGTAYTPSGTTSILWEVTGLETGNYLLTYIPGSTTTLTSSGVLVTGGGQVSSIGTIQGGGGAGRVVSVVNSDGTSGFVTMNTPTANRDQATLYYYSNDGVLQGSTPNAASAVNNGVVPGFQLYAGHAQGSTLLIREAPTASAANGTTLKAVLFDQAATPVVSLSTNTASINEAAGIATITATISSVAATDTIVTLKLEGTATGGGVDYSAAAPTITIQAGQLTGTTTLTAVQDTLDENDETIVVGIQSVSGGGNARAGTGQVTVTIIDDDLPPALSIADSSVQEGNTGTTAMVFTVSLGAASGKAVTVNYATADGTATAGSDYTAASGTLTFAAGETSKQITVLVIGDTITEANKTFTVNLSAPTNASVGTASATGTIIDDENPAPTLATPSPITLVDTAAADTFTNVTGSLSASDADGIAGYGITGSSAVNVSIDGATYNLSRTGSYGTLYLASSTGNYVYVPNATAIDALGAGPQSETFTVSATDSHASPATATASLVVNVTGANDAPTALALSRASVNQSAGVNALVGSLTTTDAESGQTHTYSLIAGNGTNDQHNASFDVVGAALQAKNAGALAAGTYNVFVRTDDGQGGHFDRAFTITVVDDVPPTTTLAGIGFNDTGENTTDFITNLAAQTVTATLSQGLAVGERVLASVNGGTDWADVTGSVLGTSLTWTAATFLPGIQELQLKVVDAANNSGTVGRQAYELDVTVPANPVITSAAQTRNAAPVISGTAEAGTRVTLTVGGATYTTTATGGNWSVDLATAQPNDGSLTLNDNGNNAVSVTSKDVAGNESPQTTQTLVIDSIAPLAPVISSPALTKQAAPVISGTAEVGASVTVTIGTATYTTTATAGAWSVDLGTAPTQGSLSLNTNGSNAVSVTATDPAGNDSPPATQALVIDTTPPATVFSAVTFSDDVGTDTTDLITNVTVQTIRATLSIAPIVGDKVFGSVDGLTWVDITASVVNTALTWENVSLPAGTGTLRLKVTDAAGNDSVVQDKTYVLDLVVPTTQATAASFSLLADTGAQSNDLITRTAQQDLSGQLNAALQSGEFVEVSVNGGTTWVRAQANVGDSTWTAGNLTLLPGAQSFAVRVSDIAGNHGEAISRAYVLDTGAPQFSEARVNGTSLVLSYTDTSLLDAVNLPANSAFTVTVAGDVIAVESVTIDATAGTVTLTLASAVTAGQAVTVAYTDQVGDDANAIQDLAGNDAATFAAVSVSNVTPVPPVTPPVTPPAGTMVDGVPVQVGTGSDGQQQITVPVVTPTRSEDNSTPNSTLADIAVVRNASGDALLNLGLPVGTGLTTNGPATTVSVTNAHAVLDGRIASVSGTAAQSAAAQAFLDSLPAGNQVVVQTVTITAQAAGGGPLVISAANLQNGQNTAVVIDTRALPAGTLLSLNNIDFAIIVGNARVTGGAGANIAYGDDDNQFILLGEGDDILHGAGGNDTVGSLRGNDQTFGDGGDDIVYGGTGNDTLHGGSGNDRMNGGFGFDTAVQSGVLSDYTYALDGHTVVLTHKVSGEIDRFLDVENIVFDSGRSIIVAHEAGDVATLTARVADAELIALNANRAVSGTAGNDEVTPTLGMALNINLGDGIDIVRLGGGRTDVHIDVEAGERAELTRLEDGAMLAFNKVEMLAFANGNVTVLAHNHAEAVIGRSYELLLGRNVDTGGYGFWITGIRTGVGLHDTLNRMMQSPEFTGGTLSNADFIESLYTTGLNRASDASGKAFWVGALENGVSRAQVLDGFASTTEAVATIGSTIDVTVVS
ncbi:DUF4214 domain-containing protein [Pigmentiphaga aceris]|uniref:DUF4214 domain-containing protein n=1 Tax=Pigmentiphaga aceris TaxID=1940612 RepID=A0A5C0AR71_9BURK|nr:Calx-beta domain-containing protein [Pigmentiphaga aceris]QEI04609.1 DUF4214 domain-containing protein [Pigmentiphaga aceris]